MQLKIRNTVKNEDDMNTRKVDLDHSAFAEARLGHHTQL